MPVRILAALLLSVLYIAASHWLMTGADASPWNAVLVLAPMLIAIALGAWRAGQKPLALLATVSLAALCGQASLKTPLPAALLYLAQHVGINVFLAVGFGGTLRAGHTALITTIASRVHRQFTPAMAAYTRNVTRAWTVYFVGMALLSLALYAWAPFDTWALFANLLTPLAVAAMFAGEYVLRYWLHPDFERTTMADAIRSYMQSGKPPADSVL
ncbi:hypothetical protein [Pseudorhodoferax sp. Leaf267]|uniref:COG4648 family protein n=1 Tax=Pseudorhodoferax sp. Leaf267 TaxID=1736316 RepID=UPI0006F812A0|nr:hypothetical protein [Pseudorhodoferax sp. Leaf267]KQP11842.1 hypothetical protein ASF43_23090 [Pseudorhodoferax sp. Leaf267]